MVAEVPPVGFPAAGRPLHRRVLETAGRAAEKGLAAYYSVLRAPPFSACGSPAGFILLAQLFISCYTFSGRCML